MDKLRAQQMKLNVAHGQVRLWWLAGPKVKGNRGQSHHAVPCLLIVPPSRMQAYAARVRTCGKRAHQHHDQRPSGHAQWTTRTPSSPGLTVAGATASMVQTLRGGRRASGFQRQACSGMARVFAFAFGDGESRKAPSPEKLGGSSSSAWEWLWTLARENAGC